VETHGSEHYSFKVLNKIKEGWGGVGGREISGIKMVII
jgi:hypothetical protein